MLQFFTKKCLGQPAQEIMVQKNLCKMATLKKTKNSFARLIIAQCKSKGSILQYFRPSLSYHMSLRSLLCLFLSTQVYRSPYTPMCTYPLCISRHALSSTFEHNLVDNILFCCKPFMKLGNVTWRHKGHISVTF